MDDKEYYSLMNRSSSWALQEALKKARKDNKSSGKETYAHLELRQGSADAAMLMAKKTTPFSSDPES